MPGEPWEDSLQRPFTWRFKLNLVPQQIFRRPSGRCPVNSPRSLPEDPCEAPGSLPGDPQQRRFTEEFMRILRVKLSSGRTLGMPPGRHPARLPEDTQEAPGRPPGDSEEAPGRAPGRAFFTFYYNHPRDLPGGLREASREAPAHPGNPRLLPVSPFLSPPPILLPGAGRR